MSVEDKNVVHRGTGFGNAQQGNIRQGITGSENAEQGNTGYHNVEREGTGDESMKREAAIRLFEAFSGVDEKYLEECERENKIFYSRIARWNQKYSRAAAAVLVLFVLGAAFVSVRSLGELQLGGKGILSENTAQMADEPAAPSSAAAMQEVAEMAEMAEEAALEAPQEAELAEGLAGAMPSEGYDSATTYSASKENAVDLYAYLPKVWADSGEQDAAGKVGATAAGESLPDNTQSNWNSNTSGTSNGTNYVAPNEAGKDRAVAGEKPVEEKAVKTEAAEVEGKGENADALVIARDTFRLTIREIAPEEDRGYLSHSEITQDVQAIQQYVADINAMDIKIYPAEEFDEACVKEQLGVETGIGTGRFGVLYSEDGRLVLVEFDGSAAVDEVWEMFASIGG